MEVCHYKDKGLKNTSYFYLSRKSLEIKISFSTETRPRQQLQKFPLKQTKVIGGDEALSSVCRLHADVKCFPS